MKYLAPLLLPFSWLYGAIVWMRNRGYDWGFLKSRSFSFPVIVVGNLEVGGTGKTPMTEYLIRLLSEKQSIAVLSRGYRRETSGYRSLAVDSLASEVGDEPLQFKRKFSDVSVSVCEDRVVGVETILKQFQPDVILLDDAFQHRRLTPGFSILLFNYQSLRFNRWFLPAGRWRDSFKEKRRADILVVTKVPDNIPPRKKKLIYRLLNPSAKQQVFFTKVSYGSPKALTKVAEELTDLPKDKKVILISGIANPKPFVEYVQRKVKEVYPIRYGDHHSFSEVDVASWLQRYNSLEGEKIIIMTEKDAMRLQDSAKMKQLERVPVYYVPIETVFVENGPLFDKLILSYVGTSQTHSRVHS